MADGPGPGLQAGRADVPTEDRGYLCRRIVAGAPDAIIFADREGIIRLWNAGAEAVFGFREAEAVGRSLDIIIPENLRQRHWDGYRRVMAGGVTRYGRELLTVPAMHRDGRRLSVEFTVIPVPAAGDDGLMGVAAILREVTARWEQDRNMKRRLRELEDRLALRDRPEQG